MDVESFNAHLRMASSSNRIRPARLADVAKAAGVSIATASYVLANRQDVAVSAATRERVAAVAAQLHYRRNAVAAALRSGTAQTIGVFVAQHATSSEAAIVLALAEIIRSRGPSVALVVAPSDSFDPSPVDGAILVGGPKLGNLDPRFLDGSLPVVEIEGTATGCQLHADDFGGARRAVDHLLTLGHRRLAHFAGPQSHPAYQERLRGFLDAVAEAGLRMDASPVVHSESELGGLLRDSMPPTALLAFDGVAAMAAYRQCRVLGLAVPDDLSVVGFGDASLAELTDPPMTMVHLSPELMAGSAVSTLERQFAGMPFPSQTLIPTSLVVRSSTARPRVGV